MREEGSKLLGVSPGGSQELQSRQRKERVVTEAGSYFLLHGGNELLRYGVRAKRQTQVGLPLNLLIHSFPGVEGVLLRY